MNYKETTPVVSGKSVTEIDLYNDTNRIATLNGALETIAENADILTVWGERPFEVPQELKGKNSQLTGNSDLKACTPLDIIKLILSKNN